ncbi:MAG: hypothetical protein ACE5EZ_03735 [Thermodesulfobacteriota bacterium]
MSLAIFLLALPDKSAVAKDVESPARSVGKKEILVAKDIGRGSGGWPLFWCGSDGVVVYNKEMGIELIKVPSGKRIKISQSKLEYPFNCSPDGRWVVYMDRASTRQDKTDRVLRAEDLGFEPELDVWPSWEGYVANLYRYEVATGKRQRFAVVRSDLPAWEVVSPDGLRAFLGSAHNSSIEMPEPKWEPLWLTHSGLNKDDWDWGQTDGQWFSDSSGVVMPGDKRLYVEIFGKGGWAKRFAVKPELKDSISALSVDKNNGIYFLVSDDVPRQPRTKHSLYRCKIDDKKLSCKEVFYRNRYIFSYDILSNGDIIFTESDDNCIRRISAKHRNAECVAGGRYNAEVLIIGISPDRKWLAYETLHELFVFELVNE